jgi:hypothetical protein
MLSDVEKYDKVVVYLNEYKNIGYKGQFRGRIKDADHPYFDREGAAIWVTTDNGFELMANLVDIYHFVITERYNKE